MAAVHQSCEPFLDHPEERIEGAEVFHVVRGHRRNTLRSGPGRTRRRGPSLGWLLPERARAGAYPTDARSPSASPDGTGRIVTLAVPKEQPWRGRAVRL